MKSDMYKPSEKRKINRVDSGEQWPTSIKYTSQWLPFPTIMEHTSQKKR